LFGLGRRRGNAASSEAFLRVESLEDRRLLAAGDLDTAFGTGGFVTTDFASQDDEGLGSALQSDGKLLVVGLTTSNSRDFALARYNTDGSLDWSFGDNGRVTTNLGGTDDAFGVVVQSTGKIVVGGRSQVGSWDFALVRYNDDGSLDTSFGSEGVVRTDMGSSADYIFDLVPGSDDSFWAVGDHGGGSSWNVAVAHYDSEGNLDASFSGDGKLVMSVGSPDNSLSGGLVVQSDGKIVLGARRFVSPENYGFSVSRYNADGTPDNSFGSEGTVTYDVGTGRDEAEAVAIQSDGKIVVAGQTHNGTDYDLAVMRLNTDGSLDTSFGGDGIVTVPVASGDNYVYDMVLQEDGKIVVSSVADVATTDFGVTRLLSDGSLDTSFGGDGIVTTDFASGIDRPTGLQLQSDGKIVATGYAVSEGTENFALARYDGGGLDFGDAPDDEQSPRYPTLLANNGARHTIVSGFHLGWDGESQGDPPPPAVDAEPDGQPSAQALGDDLDGKNDDNGLDLYSAFVPGDNVSIDVSITNRIDSDAYLNAWIDLNRDGDFDDENEHFIAGETVFDGWNEFQLAIPADAALGETFLRLRLSSQQTLGPDGAAPDGEVEDHRVEIVASTYGTIHGQKWNDLNGNGVRDPDEPGLDGVTIQLFELESEFPSAEVVTASIDCNGDQIIDPITEQGLYVFEEVFDTYYEVREVPPDGAHQTFPPNDWPYFVSIEEDAGTQVGMWPCEVAAIAGPGEGWVGNASAGADEFYGMMELEVDLGSEFDGVADDVVYVHGMSRVGLGRPDGSPATIDTELVDLEMIGGGIEVGYVRVRAGDGSLDLAAGEEFFSPGQIQQQPGDPFLADSFFDVFFKVDLDSGGTLVNQSALRLSAEIDRFTPYGTEYVFDSQQEGQEPISFYDYYEETEEARVLAARWVPVTAPNFGNQGVVTVFDFGDALDYDDPDGPGDYPPTLLVNDGARHAIVEGIHLGSNIDEDADGQPFYSVLGTSASALGDDLDSQGDDDDGVVFTSPIIPGQTATVDVTASTEGYLQGWINFNAIDDYDWDDPGEQIFTNQPLVAGVNSLSFPVPVGAQTSYYSMGRFRFSTAMDVGPSGFAPDGEVEDYQVVIDTIARDFGDGPDVLLSSYADTGGYLRTLLANRGVRHGVVPGYSIGPTVDAEYDGQPHADALGDDLNGDDEDGVTIDTPLRVGENAQITVNVTDTEGRGGYINAYIVHAESGTQREVVSNWPAVPGDNVITFQLDDFVDEDYHGNPYGKAYLRVSLGTSRPNYDGVAPDGEVEDYVVTILPPNVDYGDAPDYPYPTTDFNSGPRHTIQTGFHLGETIDGEAEAHYPGGDAQEDDRTYLDDDDGVVFDTPMIPGQQTQLTVTLTGSSGSLDAWIDLNRDGDWDDSGEKVFSSQPLVGGPNALFFTVPEGTEVGGTYMRFRLSPNGGLSPRYGGYPVPLPGEVEDYLVTVAPPGGVVLINEIDTVGSPGNNEFIELYDGGVGNTSLNGYAIVLFDGETDTSYAAFDLDGGSTNADGFYVLWPGALQDGTDAVALYYDDAANFPNGTAVTSSNLMDAVVYGDNFEPHDFGLVDALLMPHESRRDESWSEDVGTHSISREPGEFWPRVTSSYIYELRTPGAPNLPDYPDVDYGDVPNLSFPTRSEQDGARHIIVPDFCLGTTVDGEWDAQYGTMPSGEANGDDINLVYPGVPYPAGDEDGVVFRGPFAQDAPVRVTVTLTDGEGSGGMLDAWVDFNGDGDWSDAGEQVFTSENLTAGANPLAINVPLDANLGHTFARFRLSRGGGLSFDGTADNGEVEDYRVTIEPFGTTWIDNLGMYNHEMFYLDASGNNTWDRVAGGDIFHDFGLASIRVTARPVIGDWDGDGNDELGLYNDGKFYFDTTGNGVWDKVAGGDTFRDFGMTSIRATAQPVIGDFDGDGTDDLGLYNHGCFYLDTTGNGAWDKVAGGDTFRDFGIPALRAVAKPVIGDFDGDGTDDLGLYYDGRFYLDTTGNGTWDKAAGGDTFRDFGISAIRATAEPVIGDFNGDGTDDLGLHNDGIFYLDTTQNGVWDKVSGGDTYIDFGIDPIRSTGLPLAGRWAPPPQLLAAGGSVIAGPAVMDLTEDQLAPVLDHALALWAATGLAESDLLKLQQIEVEIDDLPGGVLGVANGTFVTIDVNAAGYGWYVEKYEGQSTKDENALLQSGSRLSTLDSGPQMDLLTTVMHEIGHVLGYDHDDHGVMQDQLSTGIRRVWDELGGAWDDELDFPLE
jgi:uncharacterized delta-60 repeat protein